MNRISRRSATEAAEALLEAGRTQPVLHYDVELGLERHHDWLRSGAPMPEWASASVGAAAAKSLVSVVIKSLLSAVLMGALGVAVWQARGGSQPSAAVAKPPSPSAVAPSVPDLSASESSTAPKPLPVPDHGLPSDQPLRRASRADVHDRRTPRSQRAHKELAAARAARVRAEPASALGSSEPLRSAGDSVSPENGARSGGPVDGAAVRGEATATAPATVRPSADAHGQPARGEVTAAPERKPVSTARRARPESAPEAQAPEDLVEMQQVATAEQLLERSPERALALVRQGDRRFARGYFQQERAYIAIMALIRLGRIEEARARAASFAKQFPALPYGARIRSALEAQASPRGAGDRQK